MRRGARHVEIHVEFREYHGSVPVSDRDKLLIVRNQPVAVEPHVVPDRVIPFRHIGELRDDHSDTARGKCFVPLIHLREQRSIGPAETKPRR